MWETIIPAAMSFIGSSMASDSARSQSESNIAMQREFAQNGIRWKVADAKAAGLHPLAALGAQTVGFQPVAVGDTGIGSGLSAMGQDLSRAFRASQTADERAKQVAEAARLAAMQEQFARQNHSLDVERKSLENSLLRSQLLRESQAQIGPPMAAAASSLGPRYDKVKFKPAEIVSANPMNQSLAAGPPRPGMMPVRMGGPKSGFTIEVPQGQEVADSLEAMGSLYSLFTLGRHNLSQWIDRHLTDGAARVKEPSQFFRDLWKR